MARNWDYRMGGWRGDWEGKVVVHANWRCDIMNRSSHRPQLRFTLTSVKSRLTVAEFSLWKFFPSADRFRYWGIPCHCLLLSSSASSTSAVVRFRSACSKGGRPRLKLVYQIPTTDWWTAFPWGVFARPGDQLYPHNPWPKTVDWKTKPADKGLQTKPLITKIQVSNHFWLYSTVSGPTHHHHAGNTRCEFKEKNSSPYPWSRPDSCWPKVRTTSRNLQGDKSNWGSTCFGRVLLYRMRQMVW